MLNAIASSLENFKNDEIFDEEMANIGKWLAYVVIIFALLFMIFAFFKESVLASFMEWTKTILFILVGGGVAYITIKIVFSKKKRR